METIISKDHNQGGNYIAFFDLDHTIISTNSGKVMIQQAYKQKLLSGADLIKGIFLSLLYRFDLKDTVKIIDSMVSWLKGVSEKEINILAEDLFDNFIKKTIHLETHSEITYHKEKGAKVVILSSAIYPVCKQISEYLAMDDVLCSNLEIVNGAYTGRPSGRLCFGEEKVIRLKEYCRINNIDPACSWYYGDSISDLPVLSSVGYPRCINPDGKLRKEAIKRGWKVSLWK